MRHERVDGEVWAGKSVRGWDRHGGGSVGLPGWRLWRRWFNHDDDLARGASLLNEFHRGCRIGERVGPIDHGGDMAGLDEVADLLKGLGGDPGRERLQGLAGQRVESHGLDEDRKSTRLNSSHVSISYAVFFLKK